MSASRDIDIAIQQARAEGKAEGLEEAARFCDGLAEEIRIEELGYEVENPFLASLVMGQQEVLFKVYLNIAKRIRGEE